MATLTQIIFIVACASVVNCRYTPGRLLKHQSSPEQANPTTTRRDPDAVIFPSDDGNAKNVDLMTVNQDNGVGAKKPKNEAKVDDAPLASKIVPPVEVKDVFINPVVENIDKANDKVINEKDKVINPKVGKEGKTVAVQTDVIQDAVTKDNRTEIKINDANFNKTTPDLSSRFGSTGYGSYLLVPVANNQNNQLIQTNANVPYYNYNAQGPVVQPTNMQYANNAGSNIGPSQYTPNIGPNQYTPNVVPNQYAPNVGQSQYTNIGLQTAPNVFNPSSQPNSNNYVPVNVPNTYVINGQLYAAVIVPNDNMEVISPMHYVNPQTSAYQVQKNVPLYQLVTVNNGSPQGVNNLNSMSNSQIVSS